MKFKWTQDCEEAFRRLKRLHSSAPILQSPNFEKPFTLHIDASSYALGAVLLQNSTNNDILHPICYFSSKLRPHQLNYSTVEKEALALVVALEHFALYLSSSPHKISVYSDHNPLTFINTMKSKNLRILRWALRIQPYAFEISHMKGPDNVLADAVPLGN